MVMVWCVITVVLFWGRVSEVGHVDVEDVRGGSGIVD